MADQNYFEKKNQERSLESLISGTEIRKSPEVEISHERQNPESSSGNGQGLDSDFFISADTSRAPAVKPVIHVNKDYLRIEDILQADLADYYFKMNAVDQSKFKIRGEETTAIIMELMHKSQISAKKVLELIVNWLRMITGINKFFLEQLAKIKTDRVLGLVSDRNRIIK